MRLEETVLAIKTSSAINYKNIIDRISLASKTRKPEDIIKLKHDDASIEEFFYILQDMKFMPITEGMVEKSLCINGDELIRVLNEIHDRSDVLFFFRDSVLELIDFYMSMRVTNWVLKQFYPLKIQKKTSSFFYFVMKDIEKYDFKKPCLTYNSQLKRAYLSDVKTIMEEVFNRFEQAMGDEEHFRKMYVDGVLDNIRIVEKEYLPMLFENIVLGDEVLPSGFHPNMHKRANILFDVYRILFPEKELIVSEDEYLANQPGYISYYEYRTKKVEHIIGKIPDEDYLKKENF